MSPWIKIPLTLTALLFAVVCAFLTAWHMDINGTWPYKPLERRERALTLENGGSLQIVEIENRDFGAEGNLLSAYYTPPGSTTRESAFFGGLIGRAADVRAWSYGKLVLVLQPYDHRSLSVRTPEHGWTSFGFDVPNSDKLRAGDLSFNYSRLTIEELRAIAAPLDSMPPHHSGRVTIDDFSSASGELYLTYYITTGHVNRIRLRPEPDGSAFRLVSVERFKGDTTKAVPPYVASPAPPGKLVDIGIQHLHVNCTGSGTPTVVLEAGSGDFSVVWSLVQPLVQTHTRVCSYDRAGYAWSEPGKQPRTFAQIAFELHAALAQVHAPPPYILVGQSYGGLLVRGFADEYRPEIAGMVLVDAVHEDQRVVYGGQPHRIRDSATGRHFPAPDVEVDTALMASMRDSIVHYSVAPLEPPLDQLPPDARRAWRWAEAQPVFKRTRQSETDWSPEEMARMHDRRLTTRASLGALPLIVLARTNGGYASGMSISADSLERERRNLMTDLARLSSNGTLVYAPHSGHNVHLEDPQLVTQSILKLADRARSAAAASKGARTP